MNSHLIFETTRGSFVVYALDEVRYINVNYYEDTKICCVNICHLDGNNKMHAKYIVEKEEGERLKKVLRGGINNV
jgi:hypothetical protein